jgi:polysaccharide deacetylase 2 family uncharacterized protein YibQ
MGIFKPPGIYHFLILRNLDRTMRIRFFLLLAAVLLCAGGGVYFLSSGMHRQCAQTFRDNTFVSGISRFIHTNVAFLRPKEIPTRNGRALTPLENNILDRLKSLEIADSAVVFHGLPGDTALEIHAALPRGKPFEWVIWQLSSTAAGTPYTVEDCACLPDDRGCFIRFTSGIAGQPPVLLSGTWASRYNSTSAKMSIVISDFGFAADQTTIDYLSFPEPLTVALSPSRKLSAWTARISKEYKKEIIILQPMEPAPAQRTGDDQRPACIMIHYPEERLRSIIAGAAAAVPSFSGFSNNGGARVLEDSRVTTIIFAEIKKHHGYFLEAGTTHKSVAAAIARKAQLPFAIIDFSVDTSMKLSRIQEIIDKCALDARKRGQSIICSRATDVFLRALKNRLPLLKRNGIRLSYVSELAAIDAGPQQ